MNSPQDRHGSASPLDTDDLKCRLEAIIMLIEFYDGELLMTDAIEAVEVRRSIQNLKRKKRSLEQVLGIFELPPARE